ncbi:SCO3242 family prenyltransferase [Actinoplanes couchii]|uniref:Transferase n=1 Tax=Actinoplanes couchii TaxID=403638 RepID=A0ABQ3XN59_9ACTN|nr:UbiA family prenyltransferase [Actinoplanes couchii]MDR6318132.1 4-hydroxybenzoate polyprenyltransferase [Actinoplanes couchii]GID59952.1 transferase [Actinoplanes couchii]
MTTQADRAEPRLGAVSSAGRRTGWRDLVELVRAPAALSVPGDIVAGAAAAGVLRPRTAATAAASVCLYWAGMAANDLADRHVDAVERPHRPIPSGRVSPATAAGVAAGLTAAGLTIAVAAGGRRQIPLALSLAGAIWAYDMGAKNTVAGPAVMAACRGLNVMLGTNGRWRAGVPSALVVAAHTYTVTVLSQREVEGAEPALPRRTLAATAAVAAAATAARPGRRGRGLFSQPSVRMVGSGALAAWYLARYGAAQRRAVDEPTANRIQDAVTAGITTLPVLQGALTARSGAGIAGLATAVLAPAAARLARKVSAT